MADLLRFTVPGKQEYVGVVRLAVSSAANTAGFDVEDIEDIKIAVSEVCTNVFCRCDDPVMYQIVCELGDDGIVISIDDGSIYGESGRMLQKCRELPQTDTDAYTDEYAYTSGRDAFELRAGLLMLRTLMDEVDIFAAAQERNMLIRMIKHFSRRP